jgi:nucleotide-binding universal stress UspA family protein
MAKRILVPLDRSSAAEEVVPLVAAIARGSGASVRLLVVSVEPDHLVNERGRVVAYADQESARLEAECLDYLRRMAEQFDDPSDVECAVRFGEPVTEILREADASEADLIAVTTTGRSGVGRVVLGSVAEEVLRKAQAPVVLMRPSNHRH